MLLENWNILEREYGGTCAKYITIQNLSQFLQGFGVSVET